ncbi:ATPase/histidine kinase/DNA gyrase B/HSP90 domain protein [Ostertagia ostertagi]
MNVICLDRISPKGAGEKLQISIVCPRPTTPVTSGRTTYQRINQELVNNALRHAKANTITVEVYGKADLQLAVKDDGKGFDLEAVNDKNSGMGLKNIVKRAELVGFMINITSVAGGGTKINVID